MFLITPALGLNEGGRWKAPPPDAKAYLKIVALGSSGLADVSELHDQHR